MIVLMMVAVPVQWSRIVGTGPVTSVDQLKSRRSTEKQFDVTLREEMEQSFIQETIQVKHS